MRMYVIKKGSEGVAVVRANTPNQALNVYARRTKTEIEATCIDADEMYELVVKGGLPVYEPENAVEEEPAQVSAENAAA